jgi:hypothetical protein
MRHLPRSAPRPAPLLGPNSALRFSRPPSARTGLSCSSSSGSDDADSLDDVPCAAVAALPVPLPTDPAILGTTPLAPPLPPPPRAATPPHAAHPPLAELLSLGQPPRSGLLLQTPQPSAGLPSAHTLGQAYAAAAAASYTHGYPGLPYDAAAALAHAHAAYAALPVGSPLEQLTRSRPPAPTPGDHLPSYHDISTACHAAHHHTDLGDLNAAFGSLIGSALGSATATSRPTAASSSACSQAPPVQVRREEYSMYS